MNALKGFLKFQIQIAFVRAFQSIYRHERIAARAYRALASRNLDDPRRSIMLLLVEKADRRADHYGARLIRLGSNLMPKNENWSDRLWYWLLVHVSIDFAIRWIEWVEHRDNSELTSLIHVQDFGISGNSEC
jgi:hypothetical protein